MNNNGKNVKVILRIRPLLEKECEDGASNILCVMREKNQVGSYY